MITSEMAWQAVLSRDTEFAGHFVYAVVTTGVYCRPGCAARRPRRKNVRFFEDPAAARRSGFRACRRCHPDSPPLDTEHARILASLSYLEERLDKDIGLEQLAIEVQVSPSHLQRRFKSHTGMTPREYVLARRMARFRRLVREGDGVTEASYGAGFGSSRALYESARAGLGMTPGRYARGGDSVAIGYTIVTCSLGTVLIAMTRTGVCAVLLGDDHSALRDELREEFPRARLSEGGELRESWVMGVRDHLDQCRIPLAVPLDCHGTPFQIRVWEALRGVPPGETRSYGEVAAMVDAPRAVRAVGQACARNVLAVLVPCHRVIRQSGALGRYRWGVDRKRDLLAREAAMERGDPENPTGGP